MSAGSHPVSLLRRLSEILNRQLGRIGYTLVRTSEEKTAPYVVAHEGIRYAYEPVQRLDALAPWRTDAAFLDIWQKVQSHTLVDIFRCYEIYQTVRSLAGTPGDIVEVGVWRGGTGAILAAAAKQWKPAARVWLCDTFSGVVKAGRFDRIYSGGEHADASPEIVIQLLSTLELDNTKILSGVFPEETGSAIDAASVALIHVDVDTYGSAAGAMAWAADRMSAGAVAIFDDYGFSSCSGVTRLVDELRRTGDWLWFYNINGHAILVRR